MQNFSIYYNNVRGYKSKVDSIMKIVIEKRPTIIALVETILEKENQFNIEGYVVVNGTMCEKENKNRGTIIAVRKEIRHIVKVVESNYELGEQAWIDIDNTQCRFRMGLVYGPQEIKVKKEELKLWYNSIQENVNEAKNRSMSVIVVGDMNAKVGGMISENTEEVTKGGRILKKMIENNGLIIANALQKCKGKWTRIENDKKSILDYLIIDEESEAAITNIEIDEEKYHTPYRIEALRKIYSDHCAIISTLNWTWNAKEAETKKPYSINYRAIQRYKGKRRGRNYKTYGWTRPNR